MSSNQYSLQDPSIDPLSSLLSQDRKDSISKKLQAIRQMLAETQNPTLQAPPINDLGSGIFSASTSIANAINHARDMKEQRAYMDKFLAQEAEAAQKQEQADVVVAGQLGIPVEVLRNSPPAVQLQLMKQAQEGAKQSAEDDLKNRVWQDRYNSSVMALGGNPGDPNLDPRIQAHARASADSVFYTGGDNSSTPIQGNLNRDMIYNQAKNSIPGADNGVLNPSSAAAYQAAFGSPAQDTLSNRDRVAETSIKENTANYAPIMSGLEADGKRLSNTGQNTTNAINSDDLGRKTLETQAINTALTNPGGPNLTNFFQTETLLHPERMRDLVGKGKPFKDLNAAYPDMRPQPQTNNAFQLPQVNLDTNKLAPAANAFGQVLQGNPQQKLQGAGELYNQTWGQAGKYLSNPEHGKQIIDTYNQSLPVLQFMQNLSQPMNFLNPYQLQPIQTRYPRR